LQFEFSYTPYSTNCYVTTSYLSSKLQRGDTNILMYDNKFIFSNEAHGNILRDDLLLLRQKLSAIEQIHPPQAWSACQLHFMANNTIKFLSLNTKQDHILNSETLTDQVLEEVKHILGVFKYSKYQQAIQDLLWTFFREYKPIRSGGKRVREQYDMKTSTPARNIAKTASSGIIDLT